MRILALVSDAFGGNGGIAKFNRDFLSALCSLSGVEKVVALPRLLPNAPGTLPARLAFVADGVGGKLRYGLTVLKTALANRQAGIIVCGHIHLLPLAFLARFICRAPVVLIIHGVDAWQPNRSWLVNRLARRVDAFISVSEFTRRKFLSWAGVGKSPGFILPNCVDLSQFTLEAKDAALLERLGLQNRKVLLTVARLSAQERYKGVDEVLEILPALAVDVPNVSYLIVGDGTDRARLEEKATRLGVRDRVVFAGWISDAQIKIYYNLADAFVMPGRGEGFGIVYLEALACGVPVVASTLDASAEVVRDCAHARIADPTKPETIKAAVLETLKMKPGRPVFIEKFSRQNFNERCHAIVEALGQPTLPPVGAHCNPRSILLFRIGQLGDTIVALPAIWAARSQFPQATFTLLCDRHPGKSLVLAEDLLRGSGAFDHCLSYTVDHSALGRLSRPIQMLKLLRQLRRARFDTLVYLAPSTRNRKQVERDLRFFSAAGLKNFIGMRGFLTLPAKITGQPLGETPAESDLLLARLAMDGIHVPEAGAGSLNLQLGRREEDEVNAWLSTQPADGGRPWIGIGPGSKMPAKRWPEKRFQEVVAGLIRDFDVWPVVFGGNEDRELGKRLVRAWNRGFNAAGDLSLRGAAAALKRCALFLGNDTGTMHLAASVGLPCVAVFSAREWPGMWYPYGVPRRVFRSQIDCEGCGLVECVERKKECLTRIAVEDVFRGCKEILSGKVVGNVVT